MPHTRRESGSSPFGTSKNHTVTAPKNPSARNVSATRCATASPGSSAFFAISANEASKQASRAASTAFSWRTFAAHAMPWSTENASTANRSSTAVTANGAMVPRSSGMRCR